MARELRLFRACSGTRVLTAGFAFVSWLATVGYAAAGGGLAHMVEPIFDQVLIQSVVVASVAVTILLLYVLKGLCAYLVDRRWWPPPGSARSPTSAPSLRPRV